MSSSGSSSPFSLPFPSAEPGYEYESVLPLKVQVDPRTGQRVPGTVPSLAVPGLIRGIANDLALTVQAPGAVARGQVPQAQLPSLASTMTGTLMGAGMGADTLVGEASPEVLGSFRGYHGTPYTFAPVEDNPFGKFENQAIGSGEGAQVYGWGHYVAGAKATAEDYRRNLSSPDDQILFKGKPLDPVDKYARHFDGESAPWHIEGALDKVQETGGPMAALSRINGELADPQLQLHPPEITARITNTLQKSRNWLENNLSNFSVAPKNEGSLYHVEIKPDESELLDWDKPLAEQSLGVQTSIKQLVQPLLDKEFAKFDEEVRPKVEQLTGANVYDKLSRTRGSSAAEYNLAQAFASEALHNAGVPGIKYLDQFSRGKVGISDDIRLTKVGGDQYELRAYNTRPDASNNSAVKFTTDQVHDSLSEAEVRNIVGSKVGDELFSQIPKSGKLGTRATSSGPVAFKGTSNYVIFHPDNLRIVGRNGQEVPQQLQEIDHDPFAASGALSGDDGE